MRLTDLAIVSSSSVWMTRTLTERASGEISGAFLALRFWSSSIPRKPRPSQIRSRIGWGVFANASCKDERVEAAERRRKGTDPFFHLITKQRDRFSRPHVPRFTVKQVAHIGTGFGYSEQPRLEIDHLVELLAHSFFQCGPDTKPARDPDRLSGCSSAPRRPG